LAVELLKDSASVAEGFVTFAIFNRAIATPRLDNQFLSMKIILNVFVKRAAFLTNF
jgi:hypothetical protein